MCVLNVVHERFKMSLLLKVLWFARFLIENSQRPQSYCKHLRKIVEAGIKWK